MALAQQARVDGKRGQDIAVVTRDFKYQATRMSCYTNCVHNVLRDLATAHNCAAIALSERDITRLLRDRELLGPQLADVVPRMSGHLKKWGYAANETWDRSHNQLTEVLRDAHSSFPCVGLSYHYLTDRKAVKDEGISNPPDHVVIVLFSDELETIVYEPFEGFSKQMQDERLAQKMPKGTYLMATGRFLSYWDSASDASWMFWVYRLPSSRESTKSPRLDSFTKNAGGDQS